LPTTDFSIDVFFSIIGRMEGWKERGTADFSSSQNRTVKGVESSERTVEYTGRKINGKI